MNYTKQDKKIIFFVTLILACTIYLSYFLKSNHNSALTDAFRNSEILVCYETLIVSDANWKLVEDHLINTNSAGYIDIKNCKIQSK